jgi:DNA-binding NtrC family response regulator
VGRIGVLIVEDLEDNDHLLLREPRRCERVETSEALPTALREHPWQMVLSDYALPSFNGMKALGLVRRRSPGLPVILLSAEELPVAPLCFGQHISESAQGAVVKLLVAALTSEPLLA